MKYSRPVACLVLVILVLSVLAAGWGIFSPGGEGERSFVSVTGETVSVYGQGLYKNESVSMAAQAKGQDAVTLVIGVPLLAISCLLACRGMLKGQLLLAGTLGYFLYTYASYTFLAMYNPFFLIYTALLSASFFAFVLTFRAIPLAQLQPSFEGKLPVKSIAAFLFFLALAFGMLWLGRILPPLMKGVTPAGLEHYTTMVIQAFDFSFILPAAVLAGVLLLRRNTFGLLLAAVIIMKGVTLAASITAMMLNMLRAGEEVAAAELVLFPLVTLGVLGFLVLLLRHLKEPQADMHA
ncbi:MAG: hypothetical protein K0R57_2362 [Paenibacillaceae bacterium]|jgi:hypothetical protein|nr:hypothetical protein [Paenibacillaceae bacterium]